VSTPEEVNAVAGLRELLTRMSYSDERVRELVHPDGLDLARGIAALRLRSTADEPLGRLLRLFLAGEELDLDAAIETLAPLALDQLEAAELVQQTPRGVRALVRLTPIRGLVLASDPHPGGRLAADHVIYPGPASETLAKVTIRSPATTALDLCAGSGVQALLAAKHCERVVATDLNPRALRLARLSAALNEIDNVEWREGDLFEPVSTERFDLVVANPPFVIAPARELTFRDSARRGDELSREVLVGSATRLAEGGFAHVLCSWVQAEGEHWSGAPRRWLAGLGCDVVILQLDTETAVSYAVAWTSLDSATIAEAVERAARWVDYYQELGIERIATGLIVMRRRAGENWTQAEYPASIGWEGGSQLARMFEGHDALARLPNEPALLECPVAFAPGVSMVERWRSGEQLDRARLSVEEGLSVRGRITPSSVAAAVRALDGRRTLRQAAAVAGVDPGDLSAALPCLRDLVRRGYLVIE
jgi:methylase of polypeptide subunit release factors